MARIPFNRVNWPTSIFLIGTLLISLTAVPIYLWRYGLDGFQAALFLVLVNCSSMSITLGCHRLFSHHTFRAGWPVRAETLIFGAAAFEGSALEWVSGHRRHTTCTWITTRIRMISAKVFSMPTSAGCCSN